MQGRLLNNGTKRDRVVVAPWSKELSLSQELSRADYPTTVRAHAHQGQKTKQYRYVRRILRKAAVKTTWVESLGQDSSMCWTHIENFNLCEKFDKNTFWQNLSFYFRPMIIILWQYYPIPFWAWCPALSSTTITSWEVHTSYYLARRVVEL